jgi:phosphoglycolate phosphatase-like HAD superfamily hydrolase
MECAKGSKVMAVGLSTGVSTQKELMDAGANYLVTSIADLPSLVKTTKLVARQNLKRYADLASS